MPKPTAIDFLKTFRDATARGDALEALAADIEGFAVAMKEAPEALETAMAEAAQKAGGAASVPAEVFASAACARDGRIVVADAAFAAWRIPARPLAEVVRRAQEGEPKLSAIADDITGRPIGLAVATGTRAAGWPLGDDVRSALEDGRADFAVIGVPSAQGVAWARLFGAWAFSPAQARLAEALVRTGDLRRAAAEARVSYETARETLAAAMAKTGARRQPELVRQLALLAFGEFASHDATWRTFADAFDLSARQARLAQLIALGATRGAAASALGVSEHTAKADLKVVFERCGIETAAALGRIVAEVDALARLAGATDVEIVGRDDIARPLRFVRRRRARGRIAVEDHGPHDGLPVIVFHAPVNGRRLPRVLTTAMQARGLRPISVERPGFGLTSSVAGEVVAEANADLLDVLDALGLTRVRLLGRSVAMPLGFAADHPERVDRGVLIAATPPGVRTQSGFLAAITGLALDHPRLIAAFAGMAARLSSEASIMRLTERAVGDSPSDMAALADPLNRADWIRASRQASTGDGFAREFRLHADGGVLPAPAAAKEWTVLLGEEDPVAAGVEDGLALWRAALPRGRFGLVEGGGRFLHLSHPDRVAEALAG